MALSLKDRIKELTNTTGTGTLTLVSAPSGFRRFNSVLNDGDTTYYTIESGAQFEVGIGTYSANTLTRTTVLASSNANALINITTARSFVFIVYPADKATYKDESGRIVSGAAGIIFSDNSVQTTAATTPDLSPYLTISSAASTYLTQSSATTLLAAKADLVGGLVPSSQLPSYVDDVVEAANLAAFPGTGETGKIYVAIDTGYTYRWSGSVYVRINEVDLSSYLTAATAASTYVALAGSYANPDWITQLAWSKLSGLPSAVSSLSGVNTGDQDLSSYATTAAVAAAYLPLAGGTLTGDLKFTDATYDIGKSGATRPRDGFFSRNLTVGGVLTTVGQPVLSTSSGVINIYTSNYALAANGSGISLAVGGQSAVNALGSYGCILPSGRVLAWSSLNNPSDNTTAILELYNDSSDILHQRRGTNAQTFRLAETYTSLTSFGTFQIKANAGAAYQIGSAVGSAGGTNRAIDFGHWNSAGTFTSALSIATTGNVSVLVNKWIKASDTTERLYFSSTATYVKGAQFIVRNATDSETFIINANGEITNAPVARTSGSPTAFTLTGAAHTTLTASTEATDVNFNLARTVQFATGALTTQRAFRIQAPTYSFVGASTITTASTLSISGAPTAGTNATITNAYALHIESGNALFTGQAIFNGTGSGLGLAQLQGANWWIYSGGTFQSPLFNCNGWYGMVDGANGGMQFFSEHGIVWSGSGTSGTITRNSLTGDVGLYRDASGVLAQRFGTTAQTLRVYNTYTSTTSSESGELRWTSNVLYIGSNKGSAGGSARNIAITHGGNVVANFLADRFYLGPIADSTATGGNARGQHAVDLQILRTSASQVASGAGSFLAGRRGTASGGGSFCFGDDSSATGQFAVALGCFANATAYAALAIGINAVASASQTICISNGNSGSSATAQDAIAIGNRALADRTGIVATANGGFAANGDSQRINVVLRNKTTDATPVTLFTNGSSSRLTVPSGKTMSCQVTVKGIKSDGSAKARFVRLVEITNVGGTTALDTPVEAIGTDYNPSGCDCDITPDDTNDAIQINVTGIVGETWRWVAIVEGLEIAYGT